MQRAIITLLMLSFGVSLYANDTAPRQKGDSFQYGLPTYKSPENRTEEYELYMVDTYGDGWDGSTLDLNMNGVSVATGLTVDGESNSFYFNADDYDYLTTGFTISTSWASELYYGIYDSEGYLLYDGYGNSAEVDISSHPDMTTQWTIDSSEENVFHNPSFEAGIATWDRHPDYDWAIATTGEGIYNSDATFTAYSGDNSFKMWASWTGLENNVFKVFEGDIAAQLAGETFTISAHMMSHADDLLGEGTHAKLVAKYFGPGPNGDGSNWWETFMFMDESEYLVGSLATATEWTEYSLTTTIPEGAYHIEIGFTLKKDADGGGSVYVDNLIGDWVEPVEVIENVYFSEYAEGSSNNKYLEIFNGTGAAIDLADFVVLGNYNGNGWSETIPFAVGTIVEAGDVYVIANSSADEAILAEADVAFGYGAYDPEAGTAYVTSFNGDDVRALAMAGDPSLIVDQIGTLDFDGDGIEGEGNEDDPGSGFDAAGVSDATKDHTLTRKPGMLGGNMGNWSQSAGTDAETSEYVVLDQNDWTSLGSHSNEVVEVCDFTEVTLNIADSYGDSWNGNILTVGDLNFTLDGVADDGSSASFDLCLEDGAYAVTCGGGSYLSEVSWEMLAADGTVLLAGGAPYEGFLQIGEVVDVLGCTDPEALNYDETATLDDGTCVYAGEDCATALVAAAGSNEAPSAPFWYTYTATLTGTATISSVGGGVDTQVYGYTGACDALVEVGFGDDEGGGPEWSSIMVLDVVEGESYYINWTDYWSPSGFVWTLEEALYPVTPQNLTAEAGMDNVYLAWDAAEPVGRSFVEIQNDRQARAEYQAEKKASLYPNRSTEVHLNRYSINPDYDPEFNNTRTNNVVINLGGGTWDSEISWNITNSEGTVVAEGGAPIENLELVLEDGTYNFNGFDSYGDGWNGSAVTATNATQVFLFWWLDTGSEGTAEFAVNDGAANLYLSNINYDQDTQMMSVDVNNDGTLWAYGGDVAPFIGSVPNGDCQEPGSIGQSVPQPLAPGSSYNFAFDIDLVDILGYGVHPVGAMVDWSCAVPELDENDNTIGGEITLVDPLDGITFSVYREDAASGTYALVVSGLESEMFLDESVVGGTGYCYYVTQTAAEVESGASNIACATPYGSDAFPAPTALAGEADGYDVMLSWTAPDLTGWEPPRHNSRFAPSMNKPMTHTPSNTEHTTPPATRQGGDTFETATVIDALPYVDNGSTVGLAADYGPYADLTTLVCEFGDTYYSATSTAAGPDAVYSIDLAEDAFVNISLCGSGYDTGLGVFSSDGVLVAANDDFCSLQSEVTCSMPAGMYYIVVSGWGTDAGDYVLNVGTVDPPSPVAGYNVYRDGEMVGYVEGVDETSFSEFVYSPEMPEGGTYTYAVSAYYDVQDASSVLSDPVDVTTTAPPFECVAPTNLTAENQGNDVMLSWDGPAGGPTWFTHFDGTVNSGVGTATGLFSLEAAVKFGPETTLDLMGLSLTQVAFMTSDVTALFKVMIYDPVSMLPVDSTDVIDPSTLIVGDWNIVDLPNPIALDGSEVMFGYKVTVTAEGTYPASMDLQSDHNGMDNLIAGFGSPMQSMLDAYAIDGGWAIAGYADYGQGQSIVSLDPPVFDNVINPGDFDVRHLANPLEVSLPVEQMNRALLGYHVYRNDTTIATVPPSETSYDDYDAPWGTVEYYVTAEYDDTEDCGESDPSNVVSIDLANNPPSAVNLIAPPNGATFTINEGNMDQGNMFVWSPSSDADNDPIEYYLGVETEVLGDTLDEWFPENALQNGDFEDGTDHWFFYPPEATNTSYDEDMEMLMIGGLNSGDNTENNVYQEWPGDALPVGTHFEVYGEVMSPADDFIAGDNHFVLFAKYFDSNWGMIHMDHSEPMSAQNATADMYHELEFESIVPEGVAVMQVGAMFVQATPDHGGMVGIDEIYMHVPMTVTGFEISNSMFGELMLETQVTNLTVEWDVWAFDGYDPTPSTGSRTFTVDASDLLSVNNIALPTSYALHNNYPNPFNPVTNILYDIPELTDVKLEIFNVMGQRVRTLAEGKHEAGRYQIVWNATNDIGESLSSGMYIYRIQAGDFVSVKKLVLMK